MKMTRSNLKQLIKEEYKAFCRQRALKESASKRLAGEIESWVLDFDDGESGVVHADNLIAGWEIDYPDLSIDQLWGVIDMMTDAGVIQLEGSSGYYRFISAEYTPHDDDPVQEEDWTEEDEKRYQQGRPWEHN